MVDAGSCRLRAWSSKVRSCALHCAARADDDIDRPTAPDRNAWEERIMTEKWKDEEWAQDIWYRGKVTRRRIVGWGGGAIGAVMLVPAPWRPAFRPANPHHNPPDPPPPLPRAPRAHAPP